jgi:hypothetical protein
MSAVLIARLEPLSSAQRRQVDQTSAELVHDLSPELQLLLDQVRSGEASTATSRLSSGRPTSLPPDAGCWWRGDNLGRADLAPLSALLSWARVAHTIEVDYVFEAASADRVGRCERISLPMWTNGLRHIDEDGASVDQVRGRARAACNIGGLERRGWISVGEPGTQRRDGCGCPAYGSPRPWPRPQVTAALPGPPCCARPAPATTPVGRGVSMVRGRSFVALTPIAIA